MGVPNADLYYIEQKLVYNNYLTYFKAELRIAHFGLLLETVKLSSSRLGRYAQYTVMYGL